MIKIDLTEDQLEILEPLFQEIIDSNYIGQLAAIAAQIYPDGMIVKVMYADKCKALANALGSNGDICLTAYERMEKFNGEIQ